MQEDAIPNAKHRTADFMLPMLSDKPGLGGVNSLPAEFRHNSATQIEIE
jgi:hypothetical protein